MVEWKFLGSIIEIFFWVNVFFRYFSGVNVGFSFKVECGLSLVNLYGDKWL